ncbi:hypothetical protein GOP47_0004648 [Adiantum capillus-veneris]|uniref:Uncharacterized protein n=1 Tax=Adiantum capillus-veneris TaxID=13818 RepID=A0A9D4V7U0_ADICA|nr:hypothetical protein GOP47_0004648 [Adiantum capillus-veneris]
MGRKLEDGKGWRELAVRAGLMHPHTQSRSALLATAQRVSPNPPRILSFSLLPQKQQQQQENLLSKCRHPLAIFTSIANLDSGVQLSGTHPIGVGMVLEALVQGSKVHLDELRLRMSKTLFSTSSIQNSRLCDSAKLALCLASDLQQRSRATLESLIGTKENGHTASCVLSSDFQSQLAWGVASSHRVGKAWTFFTRFSKDDYAGERLIFQVVHELDAVNKFSTIFATTIGHHPQAGFSWLHEASNKGEVRRSLSLKGLVSGDGNFSVSMKAEFGVVE